MSILPLWMGIPVSRKTVCLYIKSKPSEISCMEYIE